MLKLRCCEEAIVNPFIYACASRYREYERHSHCPRAITCDSSYHPCDRVSVVGEGELHLLFVSLERSGIKLEPFSIACREHSALGPVEQLRVVATKIVTIVQFPAKEDWLGGSDLHVVLGDILINHFICKFLYYTGQVSCKVKPSRNFDSSLGQNIVFAIEGNAYGDVSRISALVLECESRQQTDFVDELVRYAVPLCGASCLVVLNALLDGSCFLASIGIDSSRYHSGLYLKGHIGCDVHIAVLQTRSSKEVSIYHLLYAHASRNRACERNSCAWAVECDLTGYECHSIRVVGEGELYRVASLKNRSNIQLVPCRSTCLVFYVTIPIEYDSVLTWVESFFGQFELDLLISGEADVCGSIRIDGLEDIIFHEFCLGAIGCDGEALLNNVPNWGSECYLSSKRSNLRTLVFHNQVDNLVLTCDQVFHSNCIYLTFVCLELISLLESQRCGICVLKYRTLCFVDLDLLYAQGDRLIVGQFYEYVILVQHIQEHATEVVLVLFARSDYPIVFDYRRSRAVQAHVECHMCLSSTIVSHHEFEFVAISFHLSEVETEPLLTSSHLNAVPIEVDSLGTSIIYDFFGLIHFCS